MVQEGKQPVSNQIPCGLVAGREQEDDRGHQLVLSEAISCVFRRDERAQEVLTCRTAPFADEPPHVLHELARRGLASDQPIRVDKWCQQERNVGSPRAELRPIRFGDTEHLADHK
jgi:hypothetical protein